MFSQFHNFRCILQQENWLKVSALPIDDVTKIACYIEEKPLIARLVLVFSFESISTGLHFFDNPQKRFLAMFHFHTFVSIAWSMHVVWLKSILLSKLMKSF